MRVLWVADSMKSALEEAQMAAFLQAADPDAVRVDLLALTAATEPGLGREIEAKGGFVRLAGARGRKDLAAFLRSYGWVKRGKYDLIHAHTAWGSEWGAICGRLCQVPVVGTLYWHKAGEGNGRGAKSDEDAAYRALRRWATRVVALSGAQWDRYIQDGIFARSVLEVIHQGVDVSDVLAPQEELEANQVWLHQLTGFPKGVQMSVTIADLDDRESGVDVLLWAIPKVVATHRQARFVIIGEGKHHEEFERRVRARGLNKFIAWLDRSVDVRRVLAGGDLFIHPSLKDPFPIVTLKAMAAGLPVVGTRVGGIPEIIGSSDVGRLVPRGGAEALADAVIGIYRDPTVLAGMRKAAHARAKSHFNLEGWVDRLSAMYRTALEEARSPDVHRARTYARLNVELLRPRPVPGPARRTASKPRAQPRKSRYAALSTSRT
jgi:glycosyltransferase involved in cell wall biosynthesis